jgi:hypothetical protein
MTSFFLKTILGVFLVFLSLPASMCKADMEGQGVTINGVIFDVAEDRKTETIGGLTQPEGLDKYMKRHFDTLEQKIGALSTKISDLQQQIKDLKPNSKKGSGDVLVS